MFRDFKKKLYKPMIVGVCVWLLLLLLEASILIDSLPKYIESTFAFLMVTTYVLPITLIIPIIGIGSASKDIIKNKDRRTIVVASLIVNGSYIVFIIHNLVTYIYPAFMSV